MPSRPSPTFTEEARRAQIVAAAIETLAEIGYAKASLEQIARRAGISRSLINYHFESKDELIEQVLATVYNDGRQFMTSRVGHVSDPRDQLAAYIRTNLEFIQQRRSHIAAAYTILVNARAIAPQARPEADLARIRAEELRAILERGQREGVFRDFDRPAMVTAIIQAIEGAHRTATFDPDLDLATYPDELVRLFDLATRKPPTS